LVHWRLMGRLLHLVQRGGAWGCGSVQAPPRCIKSNVTAHPSTAPITVLLHNGPLLCGFYVRIKRLKCRCDGLRKLKWRQ